MKLSLNEIETKTDKQLRTLRNQLNNRISSFETNNAKNLKESHPLAGLDLEGCKEILLKVKKLLKDRS